MQCRFGSRRRAHFTVWCEIQDIYFEEIGVAFLQAHPEKAPSWIFVGFYLNLVF